MCSTDIYAIIEGSNLVNLIFLGDFKKSFLHNYQCHTLFFKLLYFNGNIIFFMNACNVFAEFMQ